VFDSLLVANRGEIACRVFRTAKRMGLRTIAVYSDVDADAMHVACADEAVCIGPAPATESYLDISKVIDAARSTGAAAIHPGYGFLSENAEFAQACVDAGIIFVGPPASAILTMGSKMASKALMEEAGVPVLPGYHGANQDADFLAQQAQQIGFPLLIKASAGGGGKGMRLVTAAEDFDNQLTGARREAKSAFGEDAVLLERYLTAPKHIEVQLMADSHGDVVHLFERDCSVQRRHQKVIEEAPAPTVSTEMRNKLGQTAIMAAKKVAYEGAGTVEFIAEGGEFYFMEMNTRLQVEHPVTEAITGMDLVEMQLRVASGEPLGITQGELTMQGHAVEVRLYAENPGKKFLPSTGKLAWFEIPDSIRVDTGVRSGDEVSMHYDPMLAKLIAHGPDRAAAVAKLAHALKGAAVAGVDHNLGYLAGVLEHDAFIAGDYTTQLAELVHEEVVPKQTTAFAILASLFVLADRAGADPWTATDGFRNNLPARQRVLLRQGKTEMVIDIASDQASVDGQSVALSSHHEQFKAAQEGTLATVSARIEGQNLSARVLRQHTVLYVMCGGHTEKFIEQTDDLSRYTSQSLSHGGVVSPMPGQVIAMNVKVGDKVKQGDVLAVVEAMKMEHSITAPKAGTVSQVTCTVGDRVDEGFELVVF
jgi:3-methylcrotonyl-CoA carboxylase alpha subunit